MPTRRADLSDTLLRGTTAPVREVLERSLEGRELARGDAEVLLGAEGRDLQILCAVADSARFDDVGDESFTIYEDDGKWGDVFAGKIQWFQRICPFPPGVRLTYRDFPGLAEYYPIGTIEGLCRHYGADYEITVDALSPRDADYTIRLR